MMLRMSGWFRSVCLIACLFPCPVAGWAAQESIEQLLKESAALTQRADHAGAIASLEKARRLAPENYQVNLLLGMNLLRSGRPKDAVQPLRQAARINSRESAAVAYLAEAFAALGEFPLAADAFQEAIRRSPKSAELWTQWADFDLERFRVLGLQLRTMQTGMATVLRVQAEGLSDGTQSREDLLKRSALADPQQTGIWGELGMEQLQRGGTEEATASLKEAQDRQPNDLWTLRLEARMAAAQGDWQHAEEYLQIVGSRSPAVLRSEFKLWPRKLFPAKKVSGDILNCLRQSSPECLARIKFPQSRALSGDKLFAEESWEQLAALHEPSPEDAQAWFWRGVAQAELDDCAQAIPALERGLDSGAESAAFWLELCYASEAQRSVHLLTALGRQAAAHRLRADILVRIKGDPKSAVGEYDQAIRLEPRNPALLERLAQAYMSFGDLPQARQSAQRALSLDPKRVLSLRLLASLAMNERDYPGALIFLEKLLAINPNLGWTRIQMGLAYAQTGKPDQALHFLQPALAAGYPDPRGALHAALARVLRQLGREQDAQRATGEAEKLAQHFEEGVQNSSDDQN